MPLNQAAMKAMKQEYGDKKGEQVYYASVNAGKVKEGTVKEACDRLREQMFPHLRKAK